MIFRILPTLFASLLIAGSVSAEIAVFPDAVTLTGPEAGQRLLVQQVTDGRVGRQIREGVTLTSSDPAIVVVEGDRLKPVANGTAKITVNADGATADVDVMVNAMDQPHLWSFRNQVQSVLSKTGCNMGACHGAAAGKNGFKLSLRGYDPEGDFFWLTRQARGRRIVPHDPGRSLVLTKPTGAIPHQGGVRFSEDSLEYRVIAEWIAQGQQGPSANDPRVTRLEMLPRQVRLTKGDVQQFVVIAHFSDGHIEDVTRWAKYNSTNFSVCEVDDKGQITVTGSGEGSVSAWYLAQNVTSTVSVPYTHDVDPALFANAPKANVIDDLVLDKLASLNMPPSPRCSDSEFLRRSTLDTLGLLPTVEETRAFLADTDPQKRMKWIDSLLTRPEFVDYWAYQWSDLLLVSGERLRPQAVKSYYDWIRQEVAANTPWNQLVRKVVTASGSTFENGAANFYALHQDPQDMAETVSMAFLGMSINCARCHDHPLEKWTNDDYYGMASLFARVRGKGWGGDFRGGDGNRTIYVASNGELIQPRTGKPQPPRPLDGIELSFDDSRDRREALADWLTAPENPYFTRAIVNRVWANFLGVGIVEQVDDLRLTNPPSNPQLLEALATDLVRNGYDLKSLMRLILQSETYQRSQEVLPTNAADERFYARYYPRRLSAEVLLDAASQVTGVASGFKDQPAGTRAIQLADASIDSYFLDTFGRPERVLTCTCERADEPSMTQVLHLTNGKTLQEKLESTDGALTKLLDAKTPDAEIVDHLYLSALTRYPTDDERQRVLQLVAETPESERRLAWEDLYWSVLTSREFLFQH